MNWLWMMVGAYLLYAIVMVAVHPQFIYPFGSDRFDNPAYTQQVVTDRNIAMATRAGDSDTAVLFFMGNGGALTYFTYTLNAHERAGRHIAALEYPGGGGIPGKPSEVRLKADALAAYDWLVTRHEGPIVVHGYSMGTGLALHVAAARPVTAIILDAPYVRMCELMTKASWLPACWMPGVQRWNSRAYLPEIDAPVLIQHGEADQLIPISNGTRLAELMRGQGIAVSFAAFPDGTHNNLAGQPGYAAQIDRFLAGLPGGGQD